MGSAVVLHYSFLPRNRLWPTRLPTRMKARFFRQNGGNESRGPPTAHTPVSELNKHDTLKHSDNSSSGSVVKVLPASRLLRCPRLSTSKLTASLRVSCLPCCQYRLIDRLPASDTRDKSW